MARSRRARDCVADLGRDAVGAVEQRGPLGDLLQRLDEHHAPAPEPLDDVLVVDDLVVDVDRRPEEVERPFQALDGHVHPGAEASGIRQDDLHRGVYLRRRPSVESGPARSTRSAASSGHRPCGKPFAARRESRAGQPGRLRGPTRRWYDRPVGAVGGGSGGSDGSDRSARLRLRRARSGPGRACRAGSPQGRAAGRAPAAGRGPDPGRPDRRADRPRGSASLGEAGAVGALDITLYRDDLGDGNRWPVLLGTEIPFAVDGAEIVLVDDVLYTGRTVRAALNAICDLGRPAIGSAWSVLVDRGHRELPIRADAVGLEVATDGSETVQVRVRPVDPADEIVRIAATGPEPAPASRTDDRPDGPATRPGPASTCSGWRISRARRSSPSSTPPTRSPRSRGGAARRSPRCRAGSSSTSSSRTRRGPGPASAWPPSGSRPTSRSSRPAVSSLTKGETFIDTARNIEAMGADVLVVRHPTPGAPHLLSQHVRASIINAGDGAHEHPTQGLLDLMTIRRAKKGRIEGLTVGLIGDIGHSRVARSNIWGLLKLGAKVILCGPPTLVPRGFETARLRGRPPPRRDHPPLRRRQRPPDPARAAGARVVPLARRVLPLLRDHRGPARPGPSPTSWSSPPARSTGASS